MRKKKKLEIVLTFRGHFQCNFINFTKYVTMQFSSNKAIKYYVWQLAKNDSATFSGNQLSLRNEIKRVIVRLEKKKNQKWFYGLTNDF